MLCVYIRTKDKFDGYICLYSGGVGTGQCEGRGLYLGGKTLQFGMC